MNTVMKKNSVAERTALLAVGQSTGIDQCPYINGEEWESSGQPVQEVVNPYTNQVIARAYLATGAEIVDRRRVGADRRGGNVFVNAMCEAIHT